MSMKTKAPTKFQRCRYQVTAGGPRFEGIAAMTSEFGTSDVRFIVSTETGEKAPTICDYRLIDRPLSYIDIAYQG